MLSTYFITVSTLLENCTPVYHVLISDVGTVLAFTATCLQEYPFVLDPFQKEAINCVENKQSVLVSAHTSAGKTAVAE